MEKIIIKPEFCKNWYDSAIISLAVGDEVIYGEKYGRKFLTAKRGDADLLFPYEDYMLTTALPMGSITEEEFRRLMANWAKTMGFRKRIAREAGRLVCRFRKRGKNERN